MMQHIPAGLKTKSQKQYLSVPTALRPCAICMHPGGCCPVADKPYPPDRQYAQWSRTFCLCRSGTRVQEHTALMRNGICSQMPHFRKPFTQPLPSDPSCTARQTVPGPYALHLRQIFYNTLRSLTSPAKPSRPGSHTGNHA